MRENSQSKMKSLKFIQLLLLVCIFVQEVQLQILESIVSSTSANSCTVNFQGNTYVEGEVIIGAGIKRYKVEDCQIHRAYQGCGTALWFMVNAVCSRIANASRKTHQHRRFISEQLLTYSCCSHFCTIFEITRYCPMFE